MHDSAMMCVQRYGALARIGMGLAFMLLSLMAHGSNPPTNDNPVLTVRCASLSKSPKTFSLEQLQQLPSKTVVTSLPPGLGGSDRQRWTGVALRTLERLSGCADGAMKVMALDAYATTIPHQDIERFDPILAYARNGNSISIRDKGPLIVIYPFDEDPRLNAQQYFNRTVWLVYAIDIQ